MVGTVLFKHMLIMYKMFFIRRIILFIDMVLHNPKYMYIHLASAFLFGAENQKVEVVLVYMTVLNYFEIDEYRHSN